MNLLDALATRCVRLERTEAPDGLGGCAAGYAEGEGFDAVLIRRREGADSEAMRSVDGSEFDVVVDADVALKFHDVFRRVADGQVFRMTGDTRDRAAPEGASVRIARAGCERWDVP